LNIDGGNLFISQEVSDGNSAVFDTIGYDVEFYGIISGLGGFTKAGEGKLRLMAQNTYSGTTNITGGTLEIAAGIDPSGTTLIDIQSGKAIFSTVDIKKSNLNVNTAENTFFEVADGTHEIGMVSGSGITMVLEDASLTATSITQGALIIGGGKSKTTQIPEPSIFILLCGAFITWICIRHWK
jgi:fibronectin-binding autotransporter adhesin